MINVGDMVLLAQITATGESTSASDVNGDGIVNSTDLVLLAQIIAS